MKGIDTSGNKKYLLKLVNTWMLLGIALIVSVVYFALPSPDAGSTSPFYLVNAVYVGCVVLTHWIEHSYFQLSKRKIRKISFYCLETAALFIIGSSLLLRVPLIGFITILWLLLAVPAGIAVIFLNIWGDHPSFRQGRLIPGLLGLIGTAWNIWYISHLT